jgi:hypothetical protein
MINAARARSVFVILNLFQDNSLARALRTKVIPRPVMLKQVQHDERGWGAGFDRLSLSAEEAPKVGLSYKARISGA